MPGGLPSSISIVFTTSNLSSILFVNRQAQRCNPGLGLTQAGTLAPVIAHTMSCFYVFNFIDSDDNIIHSFRLEGPVNMSSNEERKIVSDLQKIHNIDKDLMFKSQQTSAPF